MCEASYLTTIAAEAIDASKGRMVMNDLMVFLLFWLRLGMFYSEELVVTGKCVGFIYPRCSPARIPDSLSLFPIPFPIFFFIPTKQSDTVPRFNISDAI